MKKPGKFKRGLDAAFSSHILHGALRPIVDAIEKFSLDLQIRDNYINIYNGGNSVLKLEYHPKSQRFSAKIHHKFNPSSAFIPQPGKDYAEKRLSVGEAADLATVFVSALPELCRSSSVLDKAEGRVESGIAHANRDPPFLVLDRQVQIHGHRDSRVDILGLDLEENSPSVVLIEIKEGHRLNQNVRVQINRYRTYYEQNGALRHDVAKCLDEVLALKRDLGLIRGASPRPLRELPLHFLVVLVAEGAPIPAPPKQAPGANLVYYVGLSMDNLRIPRRELWQILCQS